MLGITRRTARDYLIYLVVRIIVCVLQSVSIDAAYRFATLLGRLAHFVDRRHRQVAYENLTHAFGSELTEADRHRMVRQVYDHFARVLVEMLFIGRKIHAHNWKRYVRFNVHPRAADMLVQDRAKILVTGHFGNWEMAGCLMAVQRMKPTSIARDLDNPFLHRLVEQLRSWSGQRVLSKKGDFDRIEQTLRDRQTLISVGDQSAGPRAHFVPFFGRLASTHKAISLLSIEHNAPIMVGYAYRDRPGFHYVVECHAPIEPASAHGDASALTAAFTHELETGIRRAPEQYFWLHRRWKDQPAKQESKRKAA